MMIKGLKVRFDVHNILYSIYKLNKTLNSNTIKKVISNHSEKDIAFIHNVTLNTMRYQFHAGKIIGLYIKKKIRDHEKILLISAITQIVFLGFKEYAVINCSVEIAKKLKLYPGLINASLKKLSKNKIKLIDIQINYNDLPKWFQNQTKDLSISEKRMFIKNFTKEPDIHIIFKNKNYLREFDEKIIKTSEISGFLINKEDIKSKKTFVKGNWWVQDFSSFFPLYNIEFKNKQGKFLDTCAAPGGKAFQLLSNNYNVVLNDKSINRIQTLKSNLIRLKFKTRILNKDFIKFDNKEKYDVIVIDAPCSSVGTIRKNPEIFFKNKQPDFESLNLIQEKMLEKAGLLLNKNGYIVYMTCSFFKNENEEQIYKFLKKNKEFEIMSFKHSIKNVDYFKLIKNNFIKTLPNNVLDRNIDGYFAAYMKKKDD